MWVDESVYRFINHNARNFGLKHPQQTIQTHPKAPLKAPKQSNQNTHTTRNIWFFTPNIRNTQNIVYTGAFKASQQSNQTNP